MSTHANPTVEKLVFRKTNQHVGRRISVTPLNSTNRHFNMPAPAYGLQLVYNNTEYPELVVPVRDGDAVLMPGGCHPNVVVPGLNWVPGGNGCTPGKGRPAVRRGQCAARIR